MGKENKVAMNCPNCNGAAYYAKGEYVYRKDGWRVPDPKHPQCGTVGTINGGGKLLEET